MYSQSGVGQFLIFGFVNSYCLSYFFKKLLYSSSSDNIYLMLKESISVLHSGHGMGKIFSLIFNLTQL